MQKFNIPIIPGYFGDNQSDSYLLQEAKQIGFPVILKADYGGGGKGIRICWEEKEFLNNLNSVRNEALKAFGNEKIMVEKFIQEPKHIEIQVFGDKQGNIVTLFERDCSIQRRHQKILEEAPADFLPQDIRNKLYEYAKKAAESVNYVGAGTVEFMIDRSGNIYFMEMNTRLQVEHGITELITGLDLVEWQLRVADGETLPLPQSLIKSNGHAAEFRICAEDPAQDFLPSPGPLNRFIFDAEPSSEYQKSRIRLDTGVRQGDQIPIYYDSMIAKLMSWAPNRNLSLFNLKSALNCLYVTGVKTNIPFLNVLMQHESISDPNKLHVDFIKKELAPSDHKKGLQVEIEKVKMANDVALITKLLIDAHEGDCNAFAEFEKVNGKTANVFDDPFKQLKWFRISLPYEEQVSITNSDNTKIVAQAKCKNKDEFIINGLNYSIKNYHYSKYGISHFKIYSENLAYQIKFVYDDEILLLNFEGKQYAYKFDKALKYDTSENLENIKSFIAPITGTVDKILIKPGDQVTKNQLLLVILAMKMEYSIKAHSDGKISDIKCKEGDIVNRNTVLIILE